MFFNERDAWYEYLDELVEAYRGRGSGPNDDGGGNVDDGEAWLLSDATNPVCQAANNIELAETIYKVTLQQGVGLSRRYGALFLHHGFCRQTLDFCHTNILGRGR
jgi:hypothetical protein